MKIKAILQKIIKNNFVENLFIVKINYLIPVATFLTDFMEIFELKSKQYN